jgi:hypothetical protein
MLLKGFCSHTFNNVQTTRLQLELYVTEGDSLPYFHYYSPDLDHAARRVGFNSD